MAEKILNHFFDNGMLSLKPNSDGEFVYFAGDLIEGNIEFTLKNPTRCRSLSVHIRGKSKVFGSYKKYQEIDNKRYENYLDEKIIIFQHSDPVELSPTETYKYSFEFRLPVELPESCKTRAIVYDDSFSIIYYCKAVLDVPLPGRNLVSKKPFTLKRRDCLNLLPLFQKPSSRNLEVEVSSSCLKAALPFKMSAEIPRTGYALGQSIPIKIWFQNQSNCEVKEIEIKLKKGEVYIYPGHESPLHHEEKRENLAKIVAQEEFVIINNSYTLVKDTVTVPSNSTSYELEYNLEIPKDIQISDLIYSQTIKNAHKVTVKAILRRNSKGPKLSIPVVIGRISSLEKGDSLPKITLQDSEYLQKFMDKGYVKPTMFKTE